MLPQTYSTKWKSFFLALLVAFYTCGYLGINWFNDYRSRYYDVSLWFEKDIPFVPAMIIGYSFVFVLIIILFLIIDNMPDFWDICRRFLAMTLICFTTFLVFPVRMNFRPAVGVGHDFITELVSFYFWMPGAGYRLDYNDHGGHRRRVGGAAQTTLYYGCGGRFYGGLDLLVFLFGLGWKSSAGQNGLVPSA